MGDTFAYVLMGIVLIVAMGVGLYLKNKNPEEKKKFTHGWCSWGLTITGVILTLFQTTIYFLDKTQFELAQLIIGIFMMIFGGFYIHKYRKQSL